MDKHYIIYREAINREKPTTIVVGFFLYRVLHFNLELGNDYRKGLLLFMLQGIFFCVTRRI